MHVKNNLESIWFYVFKQIEATWCLCFLKYNNYFPIHVSKRNKKNVYILFFDVEM